MRPLGFPLLQVRGCAQRLHAGLPSSSAKTALLIDQSQSLQAVGHPVNPYTKESDR